MAVTLEPSVRPAPRRRYAKSTRRVLTRRGVMWLGMTCNLRCYFCYFLDRIADPRHPEHDFMPLTKAKAMCKTLREVYGNTAIDIQGGEPTIYKDILELIRYCREIGLYPTLITNGIALAKPGVLESFRDAGIRDFLVSLHGIGDVHDQVVVRKGAYEKIIASIERMVELDIPFRFNCTMSEPVVPLLPEIAQKAIKYGAGAVNFIAFNPFADQQGKRKAETVARYTDVKASLTKALDMLDAAGIEANVRYLPMCMGEERHRKSFYNLQQLSYDTHEWDYASWMWTMMQPQMMAEGPLTPPMALGPWARRLYCANHLHIRDKAARHPYRQGVKFGAQRLLGGALQRVRGKAALLREEAIARARTDLKYQYGEACSRCALRNICDGFHGDYAEFFGTAEAQPITDMPVTDDPLFYIRRQEKIVEDEDRAWAL